MSYAQFDAGRTANPHTPDGADASAEWVIARLEEAGATLLALPNTGPTTRLVQGGLEWVRSAAESYGTGRAKIRPAVPSAAHITRMDQSYRWVSLIPEDKYVLRRVVGARSLVHPMTGRFLFSWRRLGTAIGADHKAVQRWHAQGIDMIVAILNGRTASKRGARKVPPFSLHTARRIDPAAAPQ